MNMLNSVDKNACKRQRG